MKEIWEPFLLPLLSLFPCRDFASIYFFDVESEIMERESFSHLIAIVLADPRLA